MRTISTSLTAKLAQKITEPGYLVQISWASTTTRFSSRGSLTALGNLWTAWDARVLNLQFDAEGRQTGVLYLGNADLSISTLILSDGIAGRMIRVWGFWSDAPSDSDVIELFNGQGDAAEISPMEVRIGLVQENSQNLYCPRVRIEPPVFNSLLPSGYEIVWGSERFRLTRG